MSKVNFCSIILGLMFISACSLTSYESARTLGKGNVRIGGGAELQVINSYDFSSFPVSTGLYFGGTYGKTDYLDLSLYSSIVSTEGGFKWQFAGTKTSKFAAAIGFNAGLLSYFPYMRTPLYLSFHPSENFCWFINPSFSFGGLSLLSNDGTGNNILSTNGGRLFSLSSGFQIGKSQRFSIGLSYLKPINSKIQYDFTGSPLLINRNIQGINLGINYFIYK
jgi:hypothetical protein